MYETISFSLLHKEEVSEKVFFKDRIKKRNF